MLKRLIPYIKPVWFRLVVAVVSMSGVATISTSLMWIMKYLIDHALADKDMGSLQSGVFLVLIGISLKSILWYTHTYLTAYVGQSAAQKIREDAYRHLYNLSMGFFHEKSSGVILARLTNDVTTLQSSLSTAPTIFIRDGLTIIGLIVFLFYSHWKFAFLCFLILPVAALVLTHLGKKSRKAGREGQAKMGEIYNTIHEALATMPIVKVFQNEKKEIDQFSKRNRHYFDAIMKLVRVEARSSPIMEFLGALVLALLLTVGGREVIHGGWSLGSFVAFIGAAMSLHSPIKKFASVNVQVQQGLAASERVFSLLDQKTTVVDAPPSLALAPIKTSLEFKDVSFSYPSSNLVLQNVNFTLNKGEVVALVGSSGSGKTTMAQLILRFYDPSSGCLLLDGVDIRQGTLKSLRHQIAIVTQETYLFNDSVYNNIAYGNPEANEEEIKKAAQAAFAHNFIIELPQGYQTVIGERGARVSGGEKQRIAIARALIKNPPILILDEATSSLDASSEQAVQLALDRLLEGRTVLMITHRLSTVRKANRIVVLEKGTIKEIGNHEELMNQKGAYRHLYELQMTA